MNNIPMVAIDNIVVGDVLTGQDGKKYIVAEENEVKFWKPYFTKDFSINTHISQENVDDDVDEDVEEDEEEDNEDKYYWKDNDNKPEFTGSWREHVKLLKLVFPQESPYNFMPGYVRTTEYRNISFIVDIEYKGSSSETTRFWEVVSTCPPCLDAKDYPLNYIHNDYYIDYDEYRNKFWTEKYSDGDASPLKPAHKFIEGTEHCTHNGTVYTSLRRGNEAYWRDMTE